MSVNSGVGNRCTIQNISITTYNRIHANSNEEAKQNNMNRILYQFCSTERILSIHDFYYSDWVRSNSTGHSGPKITLLSPFLSSKLFPFLLSILVLYAIYIHLDILICISYVCIVEQVYNNSLMLPDNLHLYVYKAKYKIQLKQIKYTLFIVFVTVSYNRVSN